MRKHPYRHQVKAHTRSGHHVHNYVRGKGKHDVKMANPTMSITPRNISKVTIKYLDQKSESFSLNTPNHAQAIKEAMEKRKKSALPMVVESVSK